MKVMLIIHGIKKRELEWVEGEMAAKVAEVRPYNRTPSFRRIDQINVYNYEASYILPVAYLTEALVVMERAVDYDMIQIQFADP